MTNPTWCDTIQCGLLRVLVDYEVEEVLLLVPKGHCTDMDGAIEFAQGMMPSCRLVHVVENDTETLINTYQILPFREVIRSNRWGKRMTKKSPPSLRG